MLRFLSQLYSIEGRPKGTKKVLLDGAFSLMHLIEVFGTLLSQMPANDGPLKVNAGLSFAQNRHYSSLELSSESLVLAERLGEIKSFAEALMVEEPSPMKKEKLKLAIRSLNDVQASLKINLTSASSEKEMKTL